MCVNTLSNVLQYDWNATLRSLSKIWLLVILRTRKHKSNFMFNITSLSANVSSNLLCTPVFLCSLYYATLLCSFTFPESADSCFTENQTINNDQLYQHVVKLFASHPSWPAYVPLASQSLQHKPLLMAAFMSVKMLINDLQLQQSIQCLMQIHKFHHSSLLKLHFQQCFNICCIKTSTEFSLNMSEFVDVRLAFWHIGLMGNYALWCSSINLNAE